MAKHGGKRPNAGRPKTKSVLPGGDAFAERVLARIGEPALTLPEVKTPEDYALYLLRAGDLRIGKETFLALLFWKHGKPTQPVEPLGFDPAQPLRVLIEHIGPAHKAPAKAK